MSDMIDRLSGIANEAGSEVGSRLAAEEVTATIAAQVRRDVRRRRVITSALAAAVVVLGAAAAVVLPQLLDPPPIVPAGDTRVPVETTEGLISYSDGSMQALTRAGHLVEVPPAEPGAPVFARPTTSQACAADPSALKPGWTPEFDDAFALVTFARPLMLDEAGYHVLAQGQKVDLGTDFDKTKFAFSLDVDPAIAPYVVMTMTSYALAPDGSVAYYASQLESEPAIEFTGDDEFGTYTATLTSRVLQGGQTCDDVSAKVDWTGAEGIVHYLTVTAFLNDGHGHVNPLATHSSWITLIKEEA